MKLTHLALSLAIAAASVSLAHAQAPAPAAAPTKPAVALASGEIINVYPKDKKVLLKHGPIPSLNMTAMTMEYGLKDAKMLAQLKKGDKVKFAAEQAGDNYFVTYIEVLK